MALTEDDFRRAANDKKFMASRWKQRVAMSQTKLDKFLSSNASEQDKKQELLMHRKRIERMKEMQRKAKNI